jgi:hypothetical protein
MGVPRPGIEWRRLSTRIVSMTDSVKKCRFLVRHETREILAESQQIGDIKYLGSGTYDPSALRFEDAVRHGCRVHSGTRTYGSAGSSR